MKKNSDNLRGDFLTHTVYLNGGQISLVVLVQIAKNVNCSAALVSLLYPQQIRRRNYPRLKSQ